MSFGLKIHGRGWGLGGQFGCGGRAGGDQASFWFRLWSEQVLMR